MMNFLHKRFPKDNFPPVIVHVLYLLLSVTFCYLYYHKFVTKADFYSPESSGGIYAVLNNTALKVVQIRVFIPLVFIALKTIISLVYAAPNGGLFYIITVIQCYFILISFYFLLNAHFENKRANLWIAPVIIYPMVWNFIIMNGQFFYMDFGILLAITLGYYFIVSGQFGWLMVVFFVGLFNHPSVGYLIPAFLLFNYQKLFQKKTILYAAILSAMYIGVYVFLDFLFPRVDGYFVKVAFSRNLSLFYTLPVHIIVRDLLLIFGAMHFLVAIMLISGVWKKFRGPFLYINFVLIPYIVSVYIYFSIEEIRNYIAIIPFVLVMALMFLSTFEFSILKPIPKVTSNLKPGEN